MSGFSIRRFVMENIAAVALHAPVSSTARAARALRSGADGVRSSWFGRLLVGSEGTSSLLSAEEMDWIRKRRQEAAEESRVVLATRPVPSVMRGVAGALLNSGVGCLVSPIVFLSVTMERLRSASGPRAAAQAPLYGLMWASLFLCTALYAAAQQVCLCSAYSLLLRPWYYASSTSPAVKDVEGPCTTRARILFPVSARFEAPHGVAGSNHPLLAYADTNEVMRERAMKRSHQRRRNKGSSTSTGKGYERKTNEDGEDYYELLGLEKTASPKEIKSAYTRLAMKIHPDHNPEPGAADKFDAVTRAYRVLSNADKRRKYDAGGAKGVEDLGAKKREGVRGLFGGATLYQLCGDVCTGTFSQRVIDGLDYTADELAVIQQRMLEQCRDELLQVYLSQYRGSAEGSAGAGRRDGEWTDTFTLQLRKVLSTGLAKEVLFTLGAEYERMVHYYDLQYKEAGAEGAKVEEVPLPALVWRRTHFFATSILPHRWQVRRMKMKYLTTVRSNSFKDSAVMVDLAWYISVEELEKTARWVAFSVLYDPSITSAEARRRRDGLLAFSAVLKRYGQAYKGANKATMDELMNSLRTYQQKKEQDRYS